MGWCVCARSWMCALLGAGARAHTRNRNRGRDAQQLSNAMQRADDADDTAAPSRFSDTIVAQKDAMIAVLGAPVSATAAPRWGTTSALAAVGFGPSSAITSAHAHACGPEGIALHLIGRAANLGPSCRSADAALAVGSRCHRCPCAASARSVEGLRRSWSCAWSCACAWSCVGRVCV